MIQWGILFVGLFLAVFIVSCSERLKAWDPPKAPAEAPNPCHWVGRTGYHDVFKCNFSKSTCIVVPDTGIVCSSKKEARDA